MKFAESSPLPNWPKPESLKVQDFSRYCGPVNQAIIDGLNRNNEKPILDKFLNNRQSITNEELKIIINVYSEQTDLILMQSGD